MSGEYLTDVRDQLASRSTQTSLSELQQRGMSRVRVIRSSAVLQLIQDAVDRTLDERGFTDHEDRDAVVAASQETFNQMMGERQKAEHACSSLQVQLDATRQQLEERAHEADILRQQLAQQSTAVQAAEAHHDEHAQELDELRAALTERTQSLSALQIELESRDGAEQSAEARVQQLEQELLQATEAAGRVTALEQALAQSEGDSTRVAQLEQQLAQQGDVTRQELDAKDLELQEMRSRAAELNAELQVLQKRSEAANPDALLGELRALRAEIQEAPRAAAPAASGGDEALQERLSDLGRELGDELARIGRKVGIKPTEEAPSDLSALFQDAPDLESNLDTLDTNESKGSDVDEALARMRRLRAKS